MTHYAFLLPNDADLGNMLEHLQQLGTPITGVYENGYSRYFDLEDPEGNGVEFAIDKAIESWHSNTQYDWKNEVSKEIDAAVVTDKAHGSYDGIPAGTTIGHAELQVADMDASTNFYVHGLGFGINDVAGSDQEFLAAGDYHHHIGLELIEKHDVVVPQENNYGLDYVNLLLPNQDGMDLILDNLRSEEIEYSYNQDHQVLMVTDPNGIQLLLSLA
ncbi:ring-cleavage extradiol dioxygenase [Lactobacillus selangorensis]|uniref:Ring-cleavage extradiol dioxygenase n=1 Tax=Lactobacillus selangorensis TaxID=81857 RepID=A0A0R2GBJ5_9LACO|nr:VOC family protein [Lactobacillus selangorensis]KRN29298.1 ring-cleavage extradiol dioxygenase [Lactobacillus selangorensis]KRN34173.1 ring-cleavage extradiol dioxygenase [Lactobacillus selangorensis]